MCRQYYYTCIIIIRTAVFTLNVHTVILPKQIKHASCTFINYTCLYLPIIIRIMNHLYAYLYTWTVNTCGPLLQHYYYERGILL